MKRAVSICGDVLEIFGQQEVVFELTCGAHRYLNEAGQLRIPLSSTAFCDIRGNRARCATQLTGKPVSFINGKISRYPIDRKREPMGLLPDF